MKYFFKVFTCGKRGYIYITSLSEPIKIQIDIISIQSRIAGWLRIRAGWESELLILFFLLFFYIYTSYNAA
jgi:hypothetical protein